MRYRFDPRSGLLIGQDVEGGQRAAVQTVYDDYRPVDGIRVPFETRINVTGATVTFRATSIRQNQPIDQQVFRRPASDE